MNNYEEELLILAESLRQVPVSFLWGMLDAVEAEICSREFYVDYPKEESNKVSVEMNKTRPKLTIVKGDKE